MIRIPEGRPSPGNAMSTLAKTTAEPTQPNAESSSSPTVLKPESPGVTPSPVCKEIPVRVRGLQPGAPVQGAADSRETFAEDTHTLILLPRGAVVRLVAPVTVGQEVMLTNLKTKQHVHCKVVSVRPSETPRGYVELAFTHRTARFWGSVAPAPKAAPSTGGSVNTAGPAGAGQIAAALKTPPGAGLQPSFDTTIQPTLTLAAVKPTRMEDLPVRRVPSADVFEPAAANLISSPVFAPQPRFSASATTPKLALQTAKSRFTGDIHTGRKGILTGAVSAVAILALACGIYLFPLHAPRVASAPAEANAAVSQASAANNSPQVIVVRADEEAPAGKPQPASEPASAAGESAQTSMTPSPTPPAAPAISSGMGDAFRKAAVKLHLNLGASKIVAPSPARAPVASATEEPPAMAADNSSAAGPAASVNEISSGMLSGGAAAIPVPTAPPDPAPKAAGRATLPRTISTVPPQYPVAAKSAHIEGDVTIQAEIDAAGKVTVMKVISGPPALQTAAQDALRQWKYEPARLNGQPVAGQIVVTLRFLLR